MRKYNLDEADVWCAGDRCRMTRTFFVIKGSLRKTTDGGASEIRCSVCGRVVIWLMTEDRYKALKKEGF